MSTAQPESSTDRNHPGSATLFRTAAGRFVTGVTVVTTMVEHVPFGMTVNAFTTVSLDPTLLLVCLHRRSRLTSAIARSGRFTVTVLAADQQDCATRFASSDRPHGWEGFMDFPHHTDPATGCPVLTDGVAHFGCLTHRRHTIGDHVVVIGAARSFGLLRSAPQLLFAEGRFAQQDSPHTVLP